MTGATASCPETRFTFLLKSTQPLAKGRPRDAEAATHCTRVAKTAIRLDPVASLALRAIPDVLQQSKSFTEADDEGGGIVGNAKRCPSSPQPARSGETMSMNRTNNSSYWLEAFLTDRAQARP